MWAWMRGLVLSLNEQSLVLLAGSETKGQIGSGVGYHIYASRRTLGQCREGEVINLMLETHVREDAITLYGFGEKSERDMFRIVTTVQGVGAKVALAILSVLSWEELARAVMAGDKTMLCRADGVGPKLASRMITELKDKVGTSFSLHADSLQVMPSQNSNGTGGQHDNNDHKQLLQDAMSALVNLGYGKSEAYQAVDRAWQEAQQNGQAIDQGKLIASALRSMAKGV